MSVAIGFTGGSFELPVGFRKKATETICGEAYGAAISLGAEGGGFQGKGKVGEHCGRGRPR